jgi:uncharacterized protein with NRDE domain
MCILFVAVKQHQDYPLIIVANRDEFFARATAESDFWQDKPHILGGRDLQAGGTWMGINKQGYIASLTNVRAPETLIENATSRGALVSDYLDTMPTGYYEQLAQSKSQYNGYNLLYGKWDALSVYNNHTDELQDLTPGFYGLSNADLNSEWPKINRGVKQLEQLCLSNKAIDTPDLFEILMDRTKAPDEQLPKTGVPVEWERHVSSIFIQGEDYGTRSSTLLTVDKQNQVNWHEKTYNNKGLFMSEKKYQFLIK